MLLHVIPHNCSEIHRNLAIPDHRSLVTQTSGMDICQIGYDICEFDSLRDLGIDNIIKWPMPLGARQRSIKMWTNYCSEIYVPYTLDDILDEGSKFQNRMFISFPQFVYCSRDEVYFPKLSCPIAAHGGTLHSKWAPYNGCYASHSWRHKGTCDVTAALWCHGVRGCLGNVSNEDLAIIENNQFTTLIE